MTTRTASSTPPAVVPTGNALDPYAGSGEGGGLPIPEPIRMVANERRTEMGRRRSGKHVAARDAIEDDTLDTPVYNWEEIAKSH